MKFLRTLRANPAITSALAAIFLWALIQVFGQVGSGFAVVVAALNFATFYVVIGLAQMLVISSGAGNIDLSIPGNMVLSAFVTLGVVAGADGNTLIGILAGLGIGVLTGIMNVVLIQLLRIPPMIATLASGFILQSIASASSELFGAKPSPAMIDFVSAKLAGLPVIALFALALTIFCAATLQRTRRGRAVLAVGQNSRAAFLAGYDVNAISASVYVLSGLIASLGGILLATFAGGAALNMANDFILTSIAVVVLGGTSVAGGHAVPLGLWASAILLQNLAIFLNVLGAPSGIRHTTTGLIILFVLALTGRRRMQ